VETTFQALLTATEVYNSRFEDEERCGGWLAAQLWLVELKV